MRYRLFRSGNVWLRYGIECEDWDSGGMCYSRPRAYTIELYVFRLSFKLDWRLTSRQITKLFKTRPELFHNIWVVDDV